MTDQTRDAIWVQSDLSADGTTYVTAIHYDQDKSRILDAKTAYAYVAEIFRASVHAEHDAAVIRQLRATGMPVELAARAVADLRADRPPLDDAATAPLRLVPGVSQKTGNGFLATYVGNRQVGQWDPDDARDHATGVLSVMAAADLDSAYRRYLVGPVGLAPGEALAAVSGLADHIGGRQ
ncbi:hypothetical protein [Acrocarpospora sp. B8E8]|uniref:hypothetical protein n=1 Tax=Acrocarpospora sp. B8E8 TaxID=3153572 RepID=UPI00325D77D9